MKIEDLPETEKPREKLLAGGAEGLSNAELLAVLIRTGGGGEISAIDLAHQVLALHPDGIRFLSSCTPEELMEVQGMGEAKACSILAAAELGRRIASAGDGKSDWMGSPQAVAHRFMERMRYHRQEHFICLCLNTRMELIGEVLVSIGDLVSASANPREVFTAAIRRNAQSVVLLHNHPSGDPTPSDADIQITRRLIRSGKLLGIQVNDHIIIGDGSYTSMMEEGLL